MELTALEQERADLLCAELDLTAPGAIQGYGAACQKQIASCSGTALSQLRAVEPGASGALLAELAAELQDFSLEPPQKRGLFRRSKKRFAERCAAAREKANQVAAVLADQRNQLTRDAVLLGKLCDSLQAYCRELSVQVLAGQRRLALGDPVPEELRDRFQRRLYDLEVSHTVGLQTMAQLRLLQKGDMELSEKITSMLSATLPLWEGQLLLALGIARAGEAAETVEAGRAGEKLSAALEELIRLRQDDTENRRSAEQVLEEQRR